MRHLIALVVCLSLCGIAFAEPTRIEVLQQEVAGLQQELVNLQRGEQERQQRYQQVQNELVAKILKKQGAIEELTGGGE